jgi:hypothetical protein
MVLVRMNVFLGLLVRVFPDHRVIMRMVVVAFMRMRMGMGMSVAVRMRRPRPMNVLFVAMRVRRFITMGMLGGRIIGREHIHLGSGDSAAAHLAHLEARTDIQRRSRLGQCLERDAGVHKGAQQHVAADAGKAFQISNAHRF